MKREQLILQTMTRLQLEHAKRLLAREVKRRESTPPPRSASNRPGPRRARGSGTQGAVHARKTG